MSTKVGVTKRDQKYLVQRVSNETGETETVATFNWTDGAGAQAFAKELRERNKPPCRLVDVLQTETGIDPNVVIIEGFARAFADGTVSEGVLKSASQRLRDSVNAGQYSVQELAEAIIAASETLLTLARMQAAEAT